MEPQEPRPDQRVVTASAGLPGSRSGSGELAGALGYPGVPAAVPNLLGASLFQQGTSGIPTLITFTAAARIWSVTLSYVITSNATFSLSTVRTVAAVQATLNPLVLAVVQLGVANPNREAWGNGGGLYPGLPVQAGETLQLNINNGVVVPQLDQQCSVSVLYSIP
jgi:hypothetical protein